ncbi:hypothetical protein ESB00_08765 [Oleiharenicola lentus]|uniref:Predicted 3'-5' exonuclease PolB-like domain-containing protein n=1 Tax=Oleiharenicola lentus TaxID=2508720 RepID=A0A4Q1CAA6_9BACT|nr:hypothetical protein [Oleiharenicola lentus]RXK55954.1 hypothetical protein ESB00_08765 [Oleiharenicola lentus]
MKTKLTSLNQISHVALAIKTVPRFALCDYEPQAQDNINRLIAQARSKFPGLTYEQYASLNPDFGRIICISVGYIVENADGDPVMRLKSYTGSEEEQLTEFNRHLANYGNTFVHAKGRSFDVPFILARMSAQEMHCANKNFAAQHRPNGYPHLDLTEYHADHGPGGRLPLSLVASMAGVASPGFDFNGQKLWAAFHGGEHRLIARHCEWSVATTLNLLRILVGNYEPIPCERYYSVEVDGECGHLAAADANGCCPSVWDDRPQFFVPSDRIPPIRPERFAS